MKRQLLKRSAKSNPQQAINIPQLKTSRKTFSLKSTALRIIFLISGLFFVSTAFGATTVTGISIAAPGQNGTATYGTGISVTYKINLTKGGSGGNGSDAISLAWNGGTPAGVTTTVTTSFNPSSAYNPNGLTFVTLTLTTTAATPAGSFSFTLTNSDVNGGGIKTTGGTLLVGAKALTITGVTANTKVYDGTTTATLGGTAVLNGVIAGDVVNLGGTPVATFSSANVGSRTASVTGYTISGASAGNYTLTLPFTTAAANITAAPLSITANVNKTYGATLTNGTGKTTFTATGLQNGQTILSVTIAYGPGAAATAAVNTYASQATPTAATGGTFTASNYSITYTPGNIIVGPTTLTGTAANQSRAYGAADPTFTVNYTGFVNGDTQASIVTTPATVTSSATVASNVGTYTLTPSGAVLSNSNYTVSYATGTLTVTKATLTIGADNKSKVQGQANPTLTVSYGGFVNGEGLANLTTPATATTTATTGSPVGNYTITPAGAASSNYTFTYSNGTLTVTAAIYDWTGVNSTNWATPQNWSVAGVQQTINYPGSSGSFDNAQIGVSASFPTITNFPIMSATPPNAVASVTFGSNSGATSLTVNPAATLNVTTLTLNTNSTANLVNNGPVNITGNFLNNTGATLTVSGSSSFTFTALSPFTNAGTITQTGGGSITLNTFAITNSGTINQSGAGSMLLEILFGSITNSGTINQTGAGTISLAQSFFLPITVTNSGTINQTGAGSIAFGGAFNNSTPASVLSQTGTGSLAFNNNFDNSGTSTFGPGTVAISGAFTNNSGTTAFGAGPATLSGTFTNTNGTVTFGTGLVTFNSNSGNTKITNSPNTILTFNNVLFTNNGHFLFKTGGGSSSAFAVASTGVMTLSNNTQLDFANAIGLTLNSDANGSATIAAIPVGCIINAPGKVTVQRYLQGSSDLSKRGYRLLSSAIYTGTDALAGNANVFDFQYLLNKIYVSGSGGATNGFNVSTTQNPTIYLFREDVAPPADNNVVFTTGYNWKGVAKINSIPNAYDIGTQRRLTTTNILDTTTTVPVGNGVLVFFRGDKTTSLVAPLTPPNDVTLMQTGTLNMGTVNVRLWFANGGNNLGNNLSYTLATTAAVSGSTASLTGGFTCLGNPYASTINWEKFNRNGTNSSLYGGSQIDNVIYMFNVYNKQYEPYQQNLAAISSVADTTTAINPGTAINQASNMIASGQGFFIITRATGQTFSFRETAKTNTLPVAASLNKLMGKPKEFVATPQPLLRLKLSKDSINTDEIVIRLNNQASSKFIHGEDVWDLGGSGALVSLSSISSDSVKLAINFMPFPGLQQQVTPLLVDATASGLYKLERTQLANLPALYDVWLKDAFTNDSLDMKANSIYQFTIDKNNAATFGSNRFTLIIRQNPALAYKLLDFNAARSGKSSHVDVVWKTENEQNYTNFTVERSNDGGTAFAVAGGLQGTGAGTYSLVDKNAVNGSNLYRLKQEDINNTITYSKVVEVLISDKNNKDADNNIHVYPNPAINVINLDVTAKIQGKASYDIIISNSSGFTIKQAITSQTSWQSGVSDLLPGTYLVKVINTKDKSLIGQSKFVKL